MSFNPNTHLIKLKGKDYLQVQWRISWFRDLHPHGVITTKATTIDLEKQIAIYHARVVDEQGGIGEGDGSETAKDFPDYIEKASTKAIGRALASLGYGTQFTGDEFNESHRIVDSPV